MHILVATFAVAAAAGPYTTSPIEPTARAPIRNMAGSPLAWTNEAIDSIAETSCLKAIWMPQNGGPVGAMAVGEGGIIIKRNATGWTTTSNAGFPNYYYGVGTVICF
jgi:hypothetical protein